MPEELDKNTKDQTGITFAVPGVLHVGAIAGSGDAARQSVRVGPSAGWFQPRGIMRWEREVSFVARGDMTPALARALRATLATEQIAPKKHEFASKAIEVSAFLPIANNLVTDARKEGVRVHTVGIDRVTSGFYYFVEGGAGDPVQAQGGLIDMLAPSLRPTNTNAEITALMEDLIDRLLTTLSGGLVSELDVELVDALPRLARDGTGLAGTNIDAFEEAARSLVRRSEAWASSARRLAEAIESAEKAGRTSASVPLYGDAERERGETLDAVLAAKALKLPARARWIVKGAPRVEAGPVVKAAAAVKAEAPAQAAGASAPAARKEVAATAQSRPVEGAAAASKKEAVGSPAAESKATPAEPSRAAAAAAARRSNPAIVERAPKSSPTATPERTPKPAVATVASATPAATPRAKAASNPAIAERAPKSSPTGASAATASPASAPSPGPATAAPANALSGATTPSAGAVRPEAPRPQPSAAARRKSQPAITEEAASAAATPAAATASPATAAASPSPEPPAPSPSPEPPAEAPATAPAELETAPPASRKVVKEPGAEEPSEESAPDSAVVPKDAALAKSKSSKGSAAEDDEAPLVIPKRRSPVVSLFLAILALAAVAAIAYFRMHHRHH